MTSLSTRPGSIRAVRDRVRSFLRDSTATAAMEFGFIGLMCIELILETMQAGLFFYDAASLDRATAKATRQIMTGAVNSAGLTAAQFRTTLLCPLLPGPMSCSNIISNIQTVSEDVAPNGFYAFVKADQSGIIPPAAMDNTKTSFCTGSTGSVVYAQVYYAMPVISPVWRLVGATSWNGSLVHFISSSAAFKNEPFPSSANAGAC